MKKIHRKLNQQYFKSLIEYVKELVVKEIRWNAPITKYEYISVISPPGPIE